MPQFNRRELDVRAREYGFNRDTFEKVLRLRTILDFFNTQEYMREHQLLKGGTAINLTVFNLPRLSADIDTLLYNLKNVACLFRIYCIFLSK